MDGDDGEDMFASPDVTEDVGLTHVAHRICPGRYLADNTVWLAAARMLAVFDITKPVDVDGNMIEPELKFVTSLTRYILLSVKPGVVV